MDECPNSLSFENKRYDNKTTLIMSDIHYFKPNSLLKDLAVGSSGWALRAAAILLLPPDRRGSDFEPHCTTTTTATGRPSVQPQRPLQGERFRAHAAPSLVDAYGRLLDIANRAASVEDMHELVRRARQELSTTASPTTALVLAQVQDELDVHPLLGAMFAACLAADTADAEEDALVMLRDTVQDCAGPSSSLNRALEPLRLDAVAAAARHLYGCKILRDDLYTAARCAYGRHAERRALREWNEMSAPEDRIVAQPADVIEVEWFPGTRLRGIPDGRHAESGEVVEIKFRVAGFARGGQLHLAEQLQVQAYMFMTRTVRCTVLEGVCRRDTVLLRHTNVHFDPAYWTAITERARRLVNFRNQLANHSLFRSAFFALSPENQVRLVESDVLANTQECHTSAAKRKASAECGDPVKRLRVGDMDDAVGK